MSGQEPDDEDDGGILQDTQRRVTEAESWVTLTYAQSLDGSISAVPGVPLLISSAASMRLTHSLRAMHGAIVVGIGTVLADNPSLTVRLVEGANPQPVIVDPRFELPVTCKLLTSSSTVRPIVAAVKCKKTACLSCSSGSGGASAAAARLAVLHQMGVEVIWCKPHAGVAFAAPAPAAAAAAPAAARCRVDIADLLAQLRVRFGSVMVEGGAAIITSVLRANSEWLAKSEKQQQQQQQLLPSSPPSPSPSPPSSAAAAAAAPVFDRAIITIAPMWVGGLSALTSPMFTPLHPPVAAAAVPAGDPATAAAADPFVDRAAAAAASGGEGGIAVPATAMSFPKLLNIVVRNVGGDIVMRGDVRRSAAAAVE